MLKRYKTNDMALILKHPKYGTMTRSRESIEKSFANIYKTFSEIVHNGNYHFDDDVLLISDIRESQFNKSDMLALALFYKMNLPCLQYEITTTIDYADEPLNFLTNNNDEKNNINNMRNENSTTKRKKSNRMKKMICSKLVESILLIYQCLLEQITNSIPNDYTCLKTNETEMKKSVSHGEV
ncbi:unnamed protein product [Adineta ricciae]|uniref:Uncharacterized protein n=1 Tax=Adineta ricciae TaxID=249248 RepID=A0A815KEW6_ADIRI|nr:unnamed protein product [Adineta ricciae]